MNKKIKIALCAVLVCIISVFSLTACETKNGGKTSVTDSSVSTSTSVTQSIQEPTEEDFKVTFTTVTEAAEAYGDFISGTLGSDNVIVTINNNGEPFLTEIIDGDKDFSEYSYGTKDYAFTDGGDHIYASDDGDIKYYLIDADEYNYHYGSYFFYINLFADLSLEGVTVELTSEGTKKTVDDKTIVSGTMSATIAYENITIVVNAVKADDLITSVSTNTTFSTPEGDEVTLFEITFEYGTAKVDIPDLTDWFNASASRTPSEWYVTGTVGGKNVEEIPTYFDYLSGCYNTDAVDLVLGDIVIIKNKNDPSIAYTQDIHSDYLAGHEVISFDPDDETIYFESEEEIEE